MCLYILTLISLIFLLKFKDINTMSDMMVGLSV